MALRRLWVKPIRLPSSTPSVAAFFLAAAAESPPSTSPPIPLLLRLCLFSAAMNALLSLNSCKPLIPSVLASAAFSTAPSTTLACTPINPQALKDGDELMDAGKLKDAIPYYEQVMEKMTFKTELHGLTALQWAICQDSLNRSDEAQVIYKKLKSHPNALVNKKARQFAFSFEAMEMMKVRRSAPRNPGYDTYFDAFVPDKPKYTSQDSKPEECA